MKPIAKHELMPKSRIEQLKKLQSNLYEVYEFVGKINPWYAPPLQRAIFYISRNIKKEENKWKRFKKYKMDGMNSNKE